MINYEKELVAELKKILPTYPELFVNNKTQTPCITYRIYNNSDTAMAVEEFGYSKLSYLIKLWGDGLNVVSVLAPYKLAIDSAMRNLGFTRESTNELSYNDQLQIVLTYSATGYEHKETN